nr:MAG TPA: hypothetical protein [Caudoviricetes sp.]
MLYSYLFGLMKLSYTDEGKKSISMRGSASVIIVSIC